MRRDANAVRAGLPDRPKTVGRDAERAGDYGGVTGDMLALIEERMAPIMSSRAGVYLPPQGTDVAHRISVAAGYIGLGLGMAAAAWMVRLAL